MTSRQVPHRRLPVIVILLLSGALVFAAVMYRLALRPELRVTGQVLALDGEPVVGATAHTDLASGKTDAQGWFDLPARTGAQWVVVQHPAFLPRTRAASPDAPVLVRLTPDDGETVSLHFGGDVMFGRRFFDPNEDGDLSDGLVRPDATSEELAGLLEHVRPLLANAHLTAVNLESPLVEDPYPHPLQPRPDRYHPTKEYVFASPPGAAAALEAADVDDVRLIEWAPPGAAPSPQYDHFVTLGAGEVVFSHAQLPGSQAWLELTRGKPVMSGVIE